MASMETKKLTGDWILVQSVRSITNSGARPIAVHLPQTGEQKEIKAGTTVRFNLSSPALDVHLRAPYHQIHDKDYAIVEIEA